MHVPLNGLFLLLHSPGVVQCSRTDAAVDGLTYSGTSNSAYAFLVRAGSDGLWSPDGADSTPAADIVINDGFIPDVSFRYGRILIMNRFNVKEKADSLWICQILQSYN